MSEETVVVSARVSPEVAERLRALTRAMGCKFEVMAGAAIRSGLEMMETPR